MSFNNIPSVFLAQGRKQTYGYQGEKGGRERDKLGVWD